MLHSCWIYVSFVLALMLGTLDGLSPQAWNLPGQDYDTIRRRSISGASAPLIAMSILAIVTILVDRYAGLGKAHPLFATGAGVIVFGIAVSSIFSLIADYATGDGVLRPMNLISGMLPGRAAALEDFFPTPAGIGAFLLAFNAATLTQSALALAGFAAMSVAGTSVIAAYASRTATGRVAYPLWVTERLFFATPTLTGALLVLIGSLIIHGSFDVDPYAFHR